MTIAVAVAVAVAVALAALVAYLAVRGELRGEVDRALEEQLDVRVRARPPSAVRAAAALRPAAGAARRADAVHPAHRRRRRRASVVGTEQVELPVEERARDVAAGVAPRFFADADVRGTHVRVLTVPVGGGRRGAVRALARAGRRRARAAAADPRAGRAWAASRSRSRSGRLVSRNVVAPIAHVTEAARHIAATEDLGRRIEVETHDEVGELAAALQRDARHARALGRRPAPARRRRLARAAHADHVACARTSRCWPSPRRCRPTSARGCWPTSRSRRPSWGCSSPT